MTVPQEGSNRLLHVVKVFAWLLLPIVIGLLVSFALDKIPSAGGLIIPVSPLVPAVLFCSAVMLYGLRSFFKKRRNLVVFSVFVCGYTAITYLIGIDAPNAVYYNWTSMYYLLLAVYIVTVLPFLSKRTIISFEQPRAKAQSTSFAASIMWLSPFFAEMLILLRWYLSGEIWHRMSYMVLGGAGTDDLLFYFGFWVLVSVISFHMLRRLLFKVSN